MILKIIENKLSIIYCNLSYNLKCTLYCKIISSLRMMRCKCIKSSVKIMYIINILKLFCISFGKS